jgi:hypothetical protein
LKEEFGNLVENCCGSNASRDCDEIKIPRTFVNRGFAFAAGIVPDDEPDFKGDPDCWYQNEQQNIKGHPVFLYEFASGLLSMSMHMPEGPALSKVGVSGA